MSKISLPAHHMHYVKAIVIYMGVILAVIVVHEWGTKDCSHNYCVTQKVVVPSGEEGVITKWKGDEMLPVWEVRIKRGEYDYFVVLPEIQLKRL
jgi:hypothetical protein